MQTWQTAASIVGVLGFILSIANFVWQFRITQQRVIISDFQVDYINGDISDKDKALDIGIGLLVTLTVVNQSSRVIPIVSASLHYHGEGSPWYCKLDTLRSKEPIICKDQLPPIYDTCLPINLQAHCSQHMSLLFCTRSSGPLQHVFYNRTSSYTVPNIKRAHHYPRKSKRNANPMQKPILFALTLSTAKKRLVFLVPTPNDSSKPCEM